MFYRAKCRFVDLQDGKRLYEADEVYPRSGLVVTDERLAELAGTNNKAGFPLIYPIYEPEDNAKGNTKAKAEKPVKGEKTAQNDEPEQTTDAEPVAEAEPETEPEAPKKRTTRKRVKDDA